MGFREDVHAHLSKFSTAPFLFVGSGFSRRYVGAENWMGLLEVFADKTHQPLARYSSLGGGDPAEIATLIAKEFHDIWWDGEEYSDSREKFPSPANVESPLKIEVARHLSKASENLPDEGLEASELESLKSAVIEGVITTNYDEVLEAVFPDFEVFVGQDGLLFRNPQGVAEIYKIHGSSHAPESLVLTTSDYRRFRDRNPYLAAKLLTVFVEHPIVFLGYSLSDPNIRELLTSIAAVLTTEKLTELQDRLIFVQWDEDANTSQITRSTFSAEGMPIPIHIVTVPNYLELFDALNGLKRRFPARILRHLKENVYKLVLTSEPSSTVYVSNLSGDVDAATVDVVIGVGAISQYAVQGIVGLTRGEVARDVLGPKIPEKDHEVIVNQVLPRMLGGGRNHTPVYRFLRGAGYLDASGGLVGAEALDKAIRVRVRLGLGPLRPKENTWSARRAAKILSEYGDLHGLITRAPLDEALLAIPSLEPDDLDASELRDFLVVHDSLLDSGNITQATQWAKAVCLYDYIVYSKAR